MNLYVHFPFCRSKCAYCALRSRSGASKAERSAYVARIVEEIGRVAREIHTVYFGGGTPALCDLRPACTAVRAAMGTVDEFTVELNPCDVTPALLDDLREGGVNRISMGVQSLDDGILRAMGRPHTAAEAEAAFRAIRAAGFGNAGFDLIAGYPSAAPLRDKILSDSIINLQATLSRIAVPMVPNYALAPGYGPAFVAPMPPPFPPAVAPTVNNGGTATQTTTSSAT